MNTYKKGPLDSGYAYTSRMVDNLLKQIPTDYRIIVALIGLVPFLTPLTFAMGRSVKLTFWSAVLVLIDAGIWVLSALTAGILGFVFFPVSIIVGILHFILWVYSIIFIFTRVIPLINETRREEEMKLYSSDGRY